MSSAAFKHGDEASLGAWCAGSLMTCLAVAFSLLGGDHVGNYFVAVLFLAAFLTFNAMQLRRIKTYGPYVLPFPAISVLPWPALYGTQPDLVARVPLVVALTSLLIWNGPTMAAIFQSSRLSSRNIQSRGTSTEPVAIPSPRVSSTSSVSPYQGVVAYQRTRSWLNDPGLPWPQSVVCRTRSATNSTGFRECDSEFERSIDLSEGSLGHGHFNPTLVERWPTPLPGYEESLPNRVNGFQLGCHGSVRSKSPVYLDG